MDLLLLASMLIGLWAFFVITGNERERRIQKLQFEIDQAARLAAAQAQKTAEIPVLR